MNNVDDELHIPWSRSALKELIKKVVLTGETNKLDFKKEFNLTNIQHKGEFLKDVSAIANTSDYNYKNHGFIAFGIEQNIISFCNFPNDEDHLQATIDELIREYIGPFINTHLYVFNEKDKKWGVLVIPPTRNAPHVFIKDIHKRYKGDIYVRNNTTTAKASPTDYSRFFRQYIGEHDYEFQSKINDLQNQISSLSSKLQKNSDVTIKENIKIEETPKKHRISKIEDNKTLSNQINDILTKEEDNITKGLFKEVKKIIDFLNSNEIPWDIHVRDKKYSEQIISKIEDVSNEFWLAIISLLTKDDKCLYEDSLIKAVKHLSVMWDAPPGVPYTEIGKNIRYYPLLVTLYLIFIIGVSKKKDKLLKKILDLKLRKRSYYEESLSIIYSLFFVRRASDLLQPFHEGYPNNIWCDAVASYTKSLIDKILTIDDVFGDNEVEFYKGEFILCISPMDIIESSTKKPSIDYPSSGLYLFFSIANVIITELLKEEISWIEKVFTRPLKEILQDFDNSASRLAYKGGCMGGGFVQNALEIAYPNITKQ